MGVKLKDIPEVRAQKVFENTEFERGVNPKDALGLGSLKVQRRTLEDLLERLEEAGIDSKFYEAFYIESDPDSQIGASLKIPTSQPNKIYYTVYREKNKGRWEYVVYYNVYNNFNTKNHLIFNSSDADKTFYFLLQKAEEGYMGEIKKVDKMLNTYKKKRDGFQSKIDSLRKYNEQ